MLEQILTVVQLRKEIPDAVGYDTSGPVIFPVPQEIVNQLPGSAVQLLKGLSVFVLYIDNYSTKVQRELKILYSGGFEYTPKISYRRRNVDVKYRLNPTDKQIDIVEIPPNESVVLEFFYPSSNFKVEQVLIGDNQVTKLMQKLAEAKRFPDITRIKVLTNLFMIFALIAVASVGYLVWNSLSERRELEALLPKMSGCSTMLYDNRREDPLRYKEGFSSLSPYWKSFVLSLNDVQSEAELKLKSKIVLCDVKE
ncbi:hypothetical protein NLO88_23730 [Pseudomonas syringae]|nr:hypothetical protein [Pseudomonas syringae]